MVPKDKPLRPEPARPAPPDLAPQPELPRVEATPADAPAAAPEAPPTPPQPPIVPPAEDWRQELSGRVEDFRRKRAGIRKKSDPGSSLNLEFGPAPGEEEAVGEEEFGAAAPQEVDADLVPPEEEEASLLDSTPLEKSAEDVRVLSSAAVEAGETALEGPEDEAGPVEIVVEPSAPRPAEKAQVASLGPRFLAALADGLVLALAGGLFGVIFWLAGGHLSPSPLNIIVLGFLVVLTLICYSGLFTALGGATPGLLWMHLQVRNAYGRPPSTAESFWRAFGYLISLASLMLGFVWAAVDSERMTWHDRISGTYVAPES